ncbi:required for meiotic nuclear division protein 1 homolog isoform X1 [Clavelina lepadiformis]|uniref:required for meiotic nuclear division protein 1 homolog isoform X1 n=1 Tax=Clavelina lepadiformis TaxID=159417 RepID=UPI004042D2D9
MFEGMRVVGKKVLRTSVQQVLYTSTLSNILTQNSWFKWCTGMDSAVLCQNTGLDDMQATSKSKQIDHSKVKSGKTISRPKTKQPVSLFDGLSHAKLCITFATADHYRFAGLIHCVRCDGHLEHVSLPTDVTNVAAFGTSHESLLRSNGRGYIFFFREGAISFWNISEDATKNFMHLAKKFEEEPYKMHLIRWESEQMTYKFVSSETKIAKNCFHFCDTPGNSEYRRRTEMYAFSNALVASVKLAHWEHALDRLIQSIESIPKDMMTGSLFHYQTPKTVLQKIGEVFMMRHQINLKHNLLDVPDVYWDREELEKLYTETADFLNVTRRVKLMNEKLSYCAHMMELAKSHLAEQKSMRIEILIVVLILIEVIFEFMHLM